MLEQRNQHLILRIARLRSGVERDRRWRQMLTECRNWRTHAGARLILSHWNRHAFTPRKSVLAALYHPVDFFKRSNIRQIAKLTRSPISGKELIVLRMKSDSKGVAQPRCEHVELGNNAVNIHAKDCSVEWSFWRLISDRGPVIGR